MTHISDSALVVLLMILPSLALAQAPAGQIVVDAAHPAWFKYQDGGPFYLCGPGDPEGSSTAGRATPTAHGPVTRRP